MCESVSFRVLVLSGTYGLSLRIEQSLETRKGQTMSAPPQPEWTFALIKPDAVKRGKAEASSDL